MATLNAATRASGAGTASAATPPASPPHASRPLATSLSPRETYHQHSTRMSSPGSPLEAESDDDDENVVSLFSADGSSSDLEALVTDYEYENGRRYHAYKAGHYPMPNDEPEADRLDLQHHIFTMLLNSQLYVAPLRPDSVRRALDIGTGTGMWAIDFADQFPNATVTGVDLSPIQPNWVPDNVRFEIDDVESDWRWKDNYFDYIHSRIMLASIEDWPRFIGRAFKHTRPGGWVEFQEIEPVLKSDDGTLEKSTFHNQFMQDLVRGAAKYGKKVPTAADFEHWMADAGFVDVKIIVLKLPMNNWPKNRRLKEVGRCQMWSYLEGYEAISIGLYTRALGWTPNEFQVLLARVRTELQDRSIHTYKPYIVAYGRKPLSGESSHPSSRSSTVEVESRRSPPVIPPHVAARATDPASPSNVNLHPPVTLITPNHAHEEGGQGSSSSRSSAPSGSTCNPRGDTGVTGSRTATPAVPISSLLS